MDDGACEFVRSSEGVGGVADSALCDEPTREGRGGGDDGLIGECDLDRSEDVGLDAAVFAEFGEEFGCSCAALPEVEVMSFHDDGWIVLLDDVIEELIGFLGEQLWGGYELDDFIGAGIKQTLLADLEGLDGVRSLTRVQDFHGVGMESQDDDSACGSDMRSRSLDEHLVSEVDRVVVPDAQGCQHVGRIRHMGVYQGFLSASGCLNWRDGTLQMI